MSERQNISTVWEQVDDPNEVAVRRVFRVLLGEEDTAVDSRFDETTNTRYSI